MFLKRQDCHIYYEIYGSGEPILFLHGNGEDHTYFQHQIEAFSNDYQVIVMDMRGHGISDFGERPLNFALFAEDVIALWNEQHIERCHVFGFSDGGNTALTLGIHYPTRCNKIIANGANLNTMGMKQWVQLTLLAQYEMTKILSFIDKEANKQLQILDLMMHQPKISIKQLQAIKSPVLVLCGSNDMIKTEHSMNIARAIPNAMLDIIPGDHFIANKQYEVVNQHVKNFLKK